MDSEKQSDRRPAAKKRVRVRRKKVKVDIIDKQFAQSTVKAILAAKADTAKRVFLEFGPMRTLAKVMPAIIAAIGPVSESSVRHWSGKYKWLAAAQEHDLKGAENDHQTIERLKEIAKVDEVAAMELVRAGMLNDLINVPMKPTDRKALSDAVRVLTVTIELMRAPNSSRSRDRSLHGSKTNVNIQGDVHVHQNHALALLDKIVQPALPEPDQSQVIDVVSTQVPDDEPPAELIELMQMHERATTSSQEHVNEDKVLSTAPEPEPAAAPVQQNPRRMLVGVEIHELAKLTGKDCISFAEALERLKRDK